MTSPIERRIAKAIENGEFDNLPGRGKPLTMKDLAGNENLAHRLLVDNGFSLPWIELKKQIDEDWGRAKKRLSQRLAWLLERGDVPGSSRRWAVEIEEFEHAVRELNQRIDQYNLRVPLSQFQRRRMQLDEELDRLLASLEE